MKPSTWIEKQMVILGLQLILIAQQSKATCSKEGAYITCENITSLDKIPANLYSGLEEYAIHIRDSNLALADTKSFNGSRMGILRVFSSNITSLETKFLENLDGIIKIEFTDSRIDKIEPFPDLQYIHTVLITRCTIGYLPTNVFHQLRRGPAVVILMQNTMKNGSHSNNTLYLDITHLPSNLFKNNSLNNLILSSDGILTFKEDTFKGLSELVALSLTQNSISAIPEKSFKDLTILHSLNLDSNKISTLSSLTFLGLSKLYSVTLSNNLLTKIEGHWFDNLQSIRHLDLNSNEISSFEIHLDNLEVLVLSNNQISNIDKNLFGKLPALTWLDLSHNSISNISPDTFKGLANLNLLSLSFNQISRLQKSVFQIFEGLKELRLSQNNITNLGEIEFYNLDNLKRLNISDNNISKLKPGVFEKLGFLEELYLEDAQLTSVNLNAFGGLKKLDILSLKGNRFDHLESDNSNNSLAALRLLNLADTPIQSLNIVDKLPSLHYFQLTGTKFENETNIAVNNHKITKLNAEMWEVQHG